LCAAVPDGVPAADAAFATIASVALHGFRLAEVGPGAKVVVLGLGLVGQLGVRLAQAAGCDVAAIDLSEAAVERARSVGALGLVEAGVDTTKAIEEWSKGRGADAVLLMAATRSSAVIARTPDLCRDRANVVVVGDIGLELDRRPFYERELTLRFARSYGPGRYERSYEDWGVDFPPGLVRWSEGRNMEAILDLLASKRLVVDDLVTHRYAIADAPAAYELVEKGEEPYLGIAFSYPGGDVAVDKPIVLRSPRRSSTGSPGVGLIGAGAFASTVLMPAFKEAGFDRFVAVASASGLSARRLAERAGFERAVSGAAAVIDDPDVEVVVIATPHNSHAALAALALRAGKHVFCEKPLALTIPELDEVEHAWRENGAVLLVGFNRRWSEPIRLVQDHFSRRRGPIVITYRVSSGAIPSSHWYNDRRQGGRLIGEVCHFIDSCAAIVGSHAVEVRALASGSGERLLQDDVTIILRYSDGSLATISCARSGHPRTEKERIEVLGYGRSATIVDFRELHLDNRLVSSNITDKGHVSEVETYALAIRGDRFSISEGIASTRSTLAVVADLLVSQEP
jgi:predicted dehydrogenase